MIIIKEKNSKIQILRACAIIAVVLIHTCPAGKWQVFVRPFINFAVALFLFLSGYLTNINNLQWKSFYKKRIIRVIIPYIIWSVFYTTISFLENGVDVKKYITNLLSSKATNTLYYILVYIQFVVFTPVIAKLAKSKYNWLGYLIAPFSVCIKYYWVITGITPNKYISILWDICCLGWFTFYYLGLLFGNKILVKNFKIKKIIVIYCITIIIQIIEGYWWFCLGEKNCGTQIKLSAFLTSSIFIFISYWYINNPNLKNTSNILIKLGDYSFGIYLMHILIIKILDNFHFYFYIPYGINSGIVLIITSVIVIGLHKVLGDKVSSCLGLC